MILSNDPNDFTLPNRHFAADAIDSLTSSEDAIAFFDEPWDVQSLLNAVHTHLYHSTDGSQLIAAFRMTVEKIAELTGVPNPEDDADEVVSS
ncbi:MAG: hypothetical protein L0I24_01115 [Pseudonocardia sp.]|nr:hypothetical protein [Pseudonocardia sp.]